MRFLFCSQCEFGRLRYVEKTKVPEWIYECDACCTSFAIMRKDEHTRLRRVERMLDDYDEFVGTWKDAKREFKTDGAFVEASLMTITGLILHELVKVGLAERAGTKFKPVEIRT